MRGKAKPANIVQSWEGITPAYAGKSKRSEDAATFQWDHPRLCGEKGFWNRCKCSREGSPPPMRGKDEIPMYSIAFFRITPAYAGKSCRCCEMLSGG